MLRERIATLSNKPTYIRVLADLMLVHLCMLAALPLTVFSELISGRQSAADRILQDFGHYYFSFFFPLSPILPAMFLLVGLYGRPTQGKRRYKFVAAACAVGTIVIVFFLLDALVVGNTFSSRTLVMFFCLLLMLAIPATRLAKSVLLTQFPYSVPDVSKIEGAVPGGNSVLVVGGAGYIGSILVRALLAKGCKVRVLDKLVYGDAAIRDLQGSRDFELMVGDCRNIQAVSGALKGIDSVVHLAAIVGDPACDLDHKTTLEINYAATRMLSEVAQGHGIRRFVFASSCSVYGATDEFVDETSATAPISLYGQTKIDAENMLLSATNDHFSPTVLRFATVFGHSHRPRFDLVVNLLTAKAHQEGVITIFNGQQWRPFIHVRDVVQAMIAVLDAPIDVVGGQIYNVGDSRLNWTLADIALKVRTFMPETKIVNVENADRRNYRVCFDKIRTQVGFQCQTTIEQGIQEMKRAFDEGCIADYASAAYHNQRYLSASGSPVNASEIDSRVMAAFAASEHAVAASV